MTNREHPTTTDLRRLLDVVEQMPDTRTPAELDRAKTRALLIRARRINRRALKNR